MRRILITAFATAFGLGLTGITVADDKAPLSFEALDSNNDGYIERADIPADHELARLFASYDLNQDNRLSRTEFEVYLGSSEVEEAEE